MRLKLFELLHLRLCFFDPSCLRKTCAQFAPSTKMAGSHVKGSSCPVGRFVVTARHIMGGSKANHIEDIEWIARAHADCSVKILNCVVRPTIMRECPASEAVGCGKVRIAFGRRPIKPNRIVSSSCGKGKIAECHERPRILVFKLDGAMSEAIRELSIFS